MKSKKTVNDANLVNKSILGKRLVTLLFLIVTINTYSQVQCSFQLVSALDCPVVAKVDWYDNCPATPGTPCDSQTFTLPSNGNTTATCNGCGTLCNVVVTLVTVNGFAPTFGVTNVDNGVWYNMSESGGTSACGGTSTYNMQYNPTVWNINP